MLAVRAWFLSVALALAALLVTEDGGAYQHIVAKGETLSQISLRLYGDARWEPVLATANGLDAQGGSVILTGMRLTVPAPTFHRATAKDTWPDLSERFYGDRDRATLLARANGGVPWVPPVEGEDLEVAPLLSHIVAEGDTMVKIAQRYGTGVRSWELDAFNGKKPSQDLVRGEVILVPLAGLTLTREAEEEARRGLVEGGGQGRDAQKRAGVELPTLEGEVKSGRYIEAVARGNRLLGVGDLSSAQLAKIHRALLEGYVALGAFSAAQAACAAWKSNLPAGELERRRLLDPDRVSPKVRAGCGAK